MPEVLEQTKQCKKCGEVKGLGDFGKYKHYYRSNCNPCRSIDSLNQFRKRVGITNQLLKFEGVKCPKCAKYFMRLDTHKCLEGFLNSSKIISKHVKSKMSGSQIRKNGNLHKIYITNFGVSIPIDYWPSDCDYTKIVLDRNSNQVNFYPINKRNKGCIKLWKGKPFPSRVYFHLSKKYNEQVKFVNPILYLEGTHVVMQFEDSTIFPIFETKADNYRSLKQMADALSTSYGSKGRENYAISIKATVWPNIAEYAYVEYIRKGFNIYPVTRSGQILLKEDKVGQWVDRDNCYKVSKRGNRFYITPTALFRQHNIPSGEWRLITTKPDGSLRFGFIRETQKAS